MSSAAAPQRGIGGFRLIAGAMVVSGVIGYAITTVAARGLADEYAIFASFWAALYLVIGAVVGFQQEFSRATSIPDTARTREQQELDRTRRVGMLRLVVVAMVVITVLVGTVGLIGARALFGDIGLQLVLPLALGTGVNAAVAAGSGVLYGVHAWRPLVTIIVGDVAIRLLVIVVALLLGGSVVAVAWAAVAPYPVLVLILVVVIRRRYLARLVVDESAPQLARNVLRTVGAGVGTSMLISGFPLLVAAAGAGQSPMLVSALIYSLILTRAPLIVSVMALQGYLVVAFRARSGSLVRAVLVLSGGILLVGGLLTAAAYLVGEPVIVLMAGERYRLAPLLIGGLVLASVTTALLSVSSSAALSRSLHSAYTVGWLGAAVVSAVLVLALPIDLPLRIIVALVIGPALGFALQLIALARARRTPSDQLDPT